jgi:phosphoglucomutase
MAAKTVEFTPFTDQKPGTYVVTTPPFFASFLFLCPFPLPLTNTFSSGLRKKVVVFQQPHYSESFVTSILLSIPEGVDGTFSMPPTEIHGTSAC